MSRVDEELPAPLSSPTAAAASMRPESDDMTTSESEFEDDDTADTKPMVEAAPSSPEPAPEVRCMWEDCGETFNNLQPFIEHLHSCAFAEAISHSPYWHSQVALRVRVDRLSPQGKKSDIAVCIAESFAQSYG